MAGTKGRSGGQNRIPDEIKARKGTLKPSRTNSKAPRPAVKLAAPPRWLTERATSIYRRLGLALLELRVIGSSDGEALALAAHAGDEFLQADELVQRDGITLTRGSTIYKNPAVSIRESAWKRYRDALRSFGMDPQSRDGVRTIDESDTGDPTARYFQ
ncbi:MAG TPA: phage terminase small subunit P27 family [Steroidobacteraceae bacterium]|jgi:P27 family predicted phage terminase small subunit